MFVKSQIRFVKSLHQKKYRIQHGLFVAEGVKLVNELLSSRLSVNQLYTTNTNLISNSPIRAVKVSENDLARMSALKTPNKVIGVFEIPQPQPLDYADWILALDRVQDPGNLGTIIRLCDWFGIKHLLCSPNTVDCYNPKTLQATMGSVARVNIVYDSIEKVVKESGLDLYGTFMEGNNVYQAIFPKAGILLLGNESHGISRELEELTKEKISIPQYGQSNVESLNVATAAAIVLSELRSSVIRR